MRKNQINSIINLSVFILLTTVFLVVGKNAQAVFSCGDTITDARDSKVYTTVLIGTQCWTAQNLNVGTKITGVTEQTNNVTIEKYCYDNNEANCTTDGGLYQWGEAMGYSASCNGTGSGQPACSSPVQGICPTGWHIPSHYEWTLLERAVCTTGSCDTDFPYDELTADWCGTTEGTKLKTGGTSGFNAVLAGMRSTTEGSFLTRSTYTLFWSSLQSDTYAWTRYLNLNNAKVSRDTNGQAYGYSTRCIMDPISIVVPTITSSVASSVTATGATLNGEITATGGENNTVRGFEYGLTTAYGTITTNVDSYTAGAFTEPISSLTPNTTYHFRSYSTNSAGTSSSTDQSFLTLANTPTSLSGTPDSSIAISLTFNANSNPVGTEYYILNDTKSTNSGWQQSLSWTSTDLSCGTEYSFKVKTRNSNNIETDYATPVNVTTYHCAGGYAGSAGSGSTGGGSTTIQVPMDSIKFIGYLGDNSNGVNTLIFQNSQLSFNLGQSSSSNTNSHTLIVTNLDLSTKIATFLIQSIPQTITLKEGESQELDLNNDNIKDILVTFNKLTVNQIDLTIKELNASGTINDNNTNLDFITLSNNDLIKTLNSPAIYEISNNTKRLYPNEATYWTHHNGKWADQNVKTITQTQFDSMVYGQNITANPGVKFIRFESSPNKVYEVTTLNNIKLKDNKELETLYGSNWLNNENIILIQNAFEVDYVVSL